jgi:hypothetical protein
MANSSSGSPEKAHSALQYLEEAGTPSPASFEEGLSHRKRLNEVKLHNRVGHGALILMFGQVLIADAAFYIYGFANDWDIPTAAITTWLAATVVQVIGVVLVIVRNLFPTAVDP